jgi:AraC-like DNA-binding protein
VRWFPDQAFEKTYAPPEAGSGAQHSVQLREGLGLVFSGFVAGPGGFVSTLFHPDLVHTCFNFSDMPATLSLGRGPEESRCGDTYLFSPQLSESMLVPALGPVRILDVFVQPADLALFAGDLRAGTASGPLESLAGLRSGPAVHRSRVTPEMRAIIDRIEGCPFHGSLKRVYLEGKVLELLALRLAQLAGAELPRSTRVFSWRHLERLHEARAIVAGKMECPPSLRDLSREVAMSPTVLKRGFREVFGETVFEHLRNLRLRRASEMLARRGTSVKEAAFAVGYASLSHFAKAFREQYGSSPRAWARTRWIR